ncbi:MAG: DUF928 domain-containing protein [Candidatus Brocadiaceae bacterium]|nr:DUF928 domain-containing protein [Candidatus Brocadiaceae bacterium]
MMKYVNNAKKTCITNWVFITCLALVLPITGFGADDIHGKGVKERSNLQNDEIIVAVDMPVYIPPRRGAPISFVRGLYAKDLKGKVVIQSSGTQKKQIRETVDIPVYKPPKRGAPRALVGGSSRGTGTGACSLSLIAPDHVGLTVQEQPSFYWFLSVSAKDRIEFTLIDNQAIQPLLEINLGDKTGPGIHHINLADHRVSLAPGKQYWWFVALVPDPDHRSRDIIAGAAIEYIEPPEGLTEDIIHAEKAMVPHVYADRGIWYDTISSMSDLINNDPDNMIFRQQCASLIEQVELLEVAEYTMKKEM